MMKSRCGCRGNVVVVVMEVSGKDVSGSSLEAASWALNTLLQSGDCLVLLGVHPADASNPCARSNLLGYRLKSELKSDPQISIERSNYIKQEELVKRKSEIEKRIAPIRVSCSQKGVRLEVEVKLGPPRIVAVQEATSLQATWVVLDRRLKKDKKFFLDQLTCGLIRMRRNNEGDILCAPHRKIEQQDNSDIEDGVIINPDNFGAYPGYESEFFSFENSQSNIKTPISSSLYQNILFTQDNMQHRFGHRDQKMEYLEGNTRKIFSNTNDNKELFENMGENLELKSGILSGNIILRKSLSGSNFDDLSETLSIISRPSISRTSSCENLAISCSPLDSRVVRFYEVAYKRAASVPVEMMMSPESVAKIVNKSSVFQAPVANNPPPVSVQPRRMHNNELLNSLLGKELFDYSSEPNYFEINDDMTKKESEYKSRISERIPIEGIGSTSINGNREIAEIVNGYDFDHCHQQQSDLLKMNNKKYQMNQLDHVWSKFVPSLLCSICKQVSPSFRHAPKMFTFAELEEATGNFSPKNFIAEGGFGFVYKGILREGQAISVKQHKIASLQGEMEFRTEVELLSCAQHRNLIMLLGFCNENGQRILVYEYVCNKSLDWHLSLRNPDALEWWARRKIAVGAARGLRYLHEECRVGCIVHRDMRPNNILLTHEFEPMVGDFGLARSQPSAEISIQTRVIGSFGYLAPEYVESGKVSWKSDVYAFGVVLLELITGYKAFDLSLPPREQILPEWTQTRLNDNRLHEIVDQRLQGSYDEFELHCMVQAAKVCISKDPSTRPKISQVLHILEGKTTDVLDSFNLLSTCYRDRDNAAAPITTNQPQKYNSFPINNINIINNNNHNSVVNSQEKKARALSSKSRKIKLSYDEML